MLKRGKQGRKEREAHEAAYPGNSSHNEGECLEERTENSDRRKVTYVLVGLELRGFLDVGFSVLKSEESQACHWRQWIF